MVEIVTSRDRWFRSFDGNCDAKKGRQWKVCSVTCPMVGSQFSLAGRKIGRVGSDHSMEGEQNTSRLWKVHSVSLPVDQWRRSQCPPPPPHNVPSKVAVQVLRYFWGVKEKGGQLHETGGSKEVQHRVGVARGMKE